MKKALDTFLGMVLLGGVLIAFIGGINYWSGKMEATTGWGLAAVGVAMVAASMIIERLVIKPGKDKKPPTPPPST